jgi:Nif-specific regulatory protein
MAENNRQKKAQIIIAESAVMKEKLDVLDKIAKSESPVLIVGESGAGKRLFAEEVHARSKRARGPFVTVNCAALLPKLAENELFGREDAEGGTLFLDEIADAALSVQAKLSHFLAGKSPDAGTVAGVRIVAATSKNLEAMIKKGLFSKDLYYRLNVLLVRVPPLRERGEDIEQLAVLFRKRYEKPLEKKFKGFSGEALSALMHYAWPGNVRELSNCIERACVAADGPFIEKDDLSLINEPSALNIMNADCDLKTAVHDFKKRFIRAVLEKNNWNQTRTARVLDIERTYLSRLIKDLGVEREA